MNKIHQLVIVSIVFILVCANILSSVRAAQLNNNSVTLSDSRINQANTQYSITVSNQSASLIRCITVRFTEQQGVNSPIPGMDISGVSLGAGSNFASNPASWSVSGSNATGIVTITNAAGELPAGGVNRSIILENITNGSAEGVAYWFEVDSFSDVSCTLGVDTNGDGTFIFTSGVLISSVVEETIDLSLNAGNCSFGELSTTSVKTCSFEASAASNSPHGYSMYYLANQTLAHSQNLDTIRPIGTTSAFSNPGTEQFGFNLVANTSPAVGANPVGGSGTPSANYNLPNRFALSSSGANIATTLGPSNETTFTASFIANISTSTVAGSYEATQTWLIVANP